MNKTICFTGHRPDKLYGYDATNEGNQKVIAYLWNIIGKSINHGFNTFITGMALGIDQWAAKIVNEYKQLHPEIKLIAAVPHKGHGNNWPEYSQQERDKVLGMCDEVFMVSDEPFTNWCMQKRNEWMVDNSDYVVAVWDGSTGGTGNCVKYAKKEEKRIVCLNPKNFTVKRLDKEN